jgi:FixJ family two-component response regulator
MSQGNCVYAVDDDVTLLQSLGRLLRSLGYTSLLFPSAETFIKHDDFDKAACILLDINIGEVSGIEVAHRLKAANVSVPIIFMTGNDQPVLREAAHRSDCLAFLTKPFSATALAQYLQRARQRPAEDP